MIVRKLRLILRENCLLRNTIYPFVSWVLNDVVKYRRILLRHYGYEALEKVMAAANRSGVVCYADYGTLLGFVRDSGFIRHDDDMDFSVLNSSDRIGDFFYALEQVGFSFERFIRFDGRINEFSMRYKEICIDFFLQRSEIGSDIFKWFFDNKGLYWAEYDYVAVKETFYIVVKGVSVRIPKNFEEVLSSYYGAWKIPVKKWDDSMGPRFKKNYGKHKKEIIRNRDAWASYLADQKHRIV